jgi:hypothetical protein
MSVRRIEMSFNGSSSFVGQVGTQYLDMITSSVKVVLVVPSGFEPAPSVLKTAALPNELWNHCKKRYDIQEKRSTIKCTSFGKFCKPSTKQEKAIFLQTKLARVLCQLYQKHCLRLLPHCPQCKMVQLGLKGSLGREYSLRGGPEISLKFPDSDKHDPSG